MQVFESFKKLSQPSQDKRFIHVSERILVLFYKITEVATGAPAPAVAV
jgi:hypothetical protein